MYSAIIVDDERKISQLILELGEWRRYDIEVTAVCTDGEEALREICEKKPDIVLTDVRMPVFDGLELIRRVNAEGLSPAFIIISGYKYFEYAYSAFKYGVVDYLLKPIEAEALNEVLEKTCGILDRQRKYQTAEDEIRRLNEHVERGKRKEMFDALFAGTDFPGTAEELERRYEKHFPYPFFQILMIRTGRSLEDANSDLLVQKMKEAVRKIFAPQSGETEYHLCMEVSQDGLAVILNSENAGDPENQRMLPRLEALLYDLREMAGMFGMREVNIGISRSGAGFADLPEAAAEAERAEFAHLVLGGDRILDLSKAHFSRLRKDQIANEKEFRSLKNALESCSTDLYQDWITGVAERCEITPPLSPEVIRELLNEILAAFAESPAGSEEVPVKDWKFEISRASSLQEGFSILREQGGARIAEWRRQRLNEEKLPIRLAKAWMAEHYGEAVSLEIVAEEVGLSPTYFSSQFRQMEGKTFSEYLTSLRMGAARELLAQSRLTNAEIASRIGYADEKYFAKVFKKEVGIRPTEYRKLYYRG